MRVLHVTPYYYPAVRYGGPIRCIHGLCKHLVRLGHDIQVFTTDLDGPSTVGRPPGVPVDVDNVKVWYFPSTWGRRLFYSRALRRELSRQIDDFDLLHIHTFFAGTTQLSASAADRRNKPYILKPHGMLDQKLVALKSPRIKRLWIRLIGRRVVEKASRIHLTTGVELEELRRFDFRLPPAFVLPLGIDLEAGQTESVRPLSPVIRNLPREKPLILFLSRINWKKGLDRLIPALRRVEGAHLVIAGNDEDNYRIKLDKLAVRAGVSDRITYTGAVYGEDKRSLFRAASLFILPSYSENFGIAVLEAMAAGLPVVVTPEVGLAGEVQRAGAGVVLPGDPGILGPGIGDLISDPGRLRRMGERGRELVARRFAWEGIAGEMAEIYREVIGSNVVRPGKRR